MSKKCLLKYYNYHISLIVQLFIEENASILKKPKIEIVRFECFDMSPYKFVYHTF